MKLISQTTNENHCCGLESYLYTNGLTALPIIALLNTSGIVTDITSFHEVLTLSQSPRAVMGKLRLTNHMRLANRGLQFY